MFPSNVRLLFERHFPPSRPLFSGIQSGTGQGFARSSTKLFCVLPSLVFCLSISNLKTNATYMLNILNLCNSLGIRHDSPKIRTDPRTNVPITDSRIGPVHLPIVRSNRLCPSSWINDATREQPCCTFCTNTTCYFFDPTFFTLQYSRNDKGKSCW